MFRVDIHPFTGRMPNQSIKITTYKFESKEKAIEFVNQYNSNYAMKVAVLVEEKQPQFA